MSINFNLDVAVECVKDIVEYNRCSVCDELGGPRLSYLCGHTACEDCTNSASYCLLCLTPPDVSESFKPIQSETETHRVRNALVLLKSCQDTFNVDVYKRSRISKQLQIEKDLFPHCIQAPTKYTNKRKSNINNLSNKENRFSILPGELTASLKEVKMEKATYIHQWLEKNENVHKQKRQPFADLNPNQQSNLNRRSPLKRRADIILEKAIDDQKVSHKINRKLSHSKKFVDTKNNLKTYMKPVEKATFSSFLTVDKNIKKYTKKHEKDESGIEVDIEPIVIEDSQHEVIDKDRLAWLAVLEAERNEPFKKTDTLQCTEVVNFTDDIEKSLISINKTDKPIFKVPFYKKGYLREKSICDTKVNTSPVKSKDVSITIETNDLITTIKVNNNGNILSKSGNKRTVSVQTDILGLTNEGYRNVATDTINIKELEDMRKDKCTNKINIESEDLFTNDVKEIPIKEMGPVVKVVNETQCVDVISDSDEEINQSGVIQVSAEVHRSSNEMDYGVLAEMNKAELSSRILARPTRGLSPGSTDSSDKENYDPNRRKRSHITKKKLEKKRKFNTCK